MSSNSSASSVSLSIGSPTITLLVILMLLVIFFIGFFTVCFYRCFMEGNMSGWHLRQGSGGPVNLASSKENPGIDSSIIRLYPTFTYSSVKGFRREEYGIECAICLSDFSDDDLLRFLTVCYHVFHQDCIDLWLESHKTCPVCRRDLDLPKEALENMQTLDHIAGSVDRTSESNASLEHAVGIHIREGEEGREENANGGMTQHVLKRHEGHEKMLGISRSHTTGHSFFAARAEEDRYTLRLQDHVKVNIVRGHGATESCITFGDFSSPINGGNGELSGPSNRDVNKA